MCLCNCRHSTSQRLFQSSRSLAAIVLRINLCISSHIIIYFKKIWNYLCVFNLLNSKTLGGEVSWMTRSFSESTYLHSMLNGKYHREKCHQECSGQLFMLWRNTIWRTAYLQGVLHWWCKGGIAKSAPRCWARASGLMEGEYYVKSLYWT